MMRDNLNNAILFAGMLLGTVLL